MAMLGKFFSAATYAVVQLYSSEIFPTSVRNSCMGGKNLLYCFTMHIVKYNLNIIIVCSMIARLGPIAAPMVNGLVLIKIFFFLKLKIQLVNSPRVIGNLKHSLFCSLVLLVYLLH